MNKYLKIIMILLIIIIYIKGAIWMFQTDTYSLGKTIFKTSIVSLLGGYLFINIMSLFINKSSANTLAEVFGFLYVPVTLIIGIVGLFMWIFS